MPCGGTLELLLEFNPSAALLSALVQRLESGGLVQRVTDLASGEVHLESVSQIDELSIDSKTLKNTYGPEYRMLLIGAGQMAEYLASMALFNGFHVTVCDPRNAGSLDTVGLAG